MYGAATTSDEYVYGAATTSDEYVYGAATTSDEYVYGATSNGAYDEYGCRCEGTIVRTVGELDSECSGRSRPTRAHKKQVSPATANAGWASNG